MDVCFFRHGPAVARGSAGVEEEERALTTEGRKKTAQAAKGIRALELEIDAIFSSPLRRALETAEIAATVLGLPEAGHVDFLKPGVPPRRLLEALRDLKCKTPLLVGHEPLFSEAVSLAVCGSAAGSFELKKAGLAVVTIEDLHASLKGSLKLLLTPSSLRRLGS